MPSDLMLKSMNAVHRTALKLSGGRIGTNMFGMPSLELVTIGRKSGQPRPTMLSAPLVDGDTIVVVASRGGDPTHPAWLLNLRDNPKVEVSFQGGPSRPMTARIASADERAELWPRVVDAWSEYGKYQQRTTREIPLVLLTPRAGG